MTKKISDTMQIGIAIVGLAIAYATFSGKGKGEGGTGGGGGLDIPFIPDLSGFFTPAAPADVVAGQPVISGGSLRSFVESALQLNPDTYAATGKKTYSGQRTIGDTTYFVEGNTDIAGNLLNQQTGQLYSQLSTGEKLYSEKATTSLPVIAKKGSETTSALFGNQSGYGGIAATGGAAGASGSRPGGKGTWTSAGYTTRY